MNDCFSGGGNPFGARSPFGQNIDPEDILKSFFGERGSPFGFATSSGGFEDFNQVQQVHYNKLGILSNDDGSSNSELKKTQ